jgi:hypothetical protein
MRSRLALRCEGKYGGLSASRNQWCSRRRQKQRRLTESGGVHITVFSGLDMARTFGRVRCIGAGSFTAKNKKWTLVEAFSRQRRGRTKPSYHPCWHPSRPPAYFPCCAVGRAQRTEPAATPGAVPRATRVTTWHHRGLQVRIPRSRVRVETLVAMKAIPKQIAPSHTTDTLERDADARRCKKPLVQVETRGNLRLERRAKAIFPLWSILRST